jgi:hypothetical protein
LQSNYRDLFGFHLGAWVFYNVKPDLTGFNHVGTRESDGFRLLSVVLLLAAAAVCCVRSVLAPSRHPSMSVACLF